MSIMNLIESASGILKKALSRGGQFAEIYIEERIVTNIRCEDNKIEKVVSGSECGIGIRVLHDLKTAYAYSNNLGRQAVLNLADTISCAVNKQIEPNIIIPQITPKDYSKSSKTNEQTTTDKAELVNYANHLARKIDKRIVQVKVVSADLVQKVTIINSEGLYCYDERCDRIFLVMAVATDGSIIQTGYELKGGSADYIIDDGLAAKVADIAAKRAILMLEAKPAPAGSMPIVLSGMAGGTMVHEAIGHGLEADLAQNKLSVFSERLGQQVAADTITVLDDATIADKRGSYSFDDEGTPAQKTVLVENGILKGYMYDRLTALKDGAKSTGNGRRQNYQHQPIVRMTNTLIDKGQSDPKDMITSVDKGLWVTSLGGGQVNTVNGDFVFEVNEGYLIENGKIGAAVRGATITGNGPRILTQVEAVGNDLGFAIGTCGKDAQFCPCADAQPSLLIPKIVVGGAG